MMRRCVVLSCLTLVAIAAVPVVGAQTGPIITPDNLKVPSEHVLLFKTFATGTQIYTCKARTDDPNTFEWTFKAPEAELWNDIGEKVGKHYAGPSWEGNDGSKLVGEVVERANAPDPGAIPWLLLKAKANDGAGVFSTMTYIQRLETVGGMAPTEGCDRLAADAERAVEYTAIYAFFYGAAQ
jgi:hypothetical protein